MAQKMTQNNEPARRYRDEPKMRGLVLAVGVTLVLLAGAVPASAQPLYDGYLKVKGNGKVRKSIQGAGWQTVFKERAEGRVRYRVCLTHMPTKTSRCWKRRTSASGISVVFVALFVNDRGGPGPWRARFLVHGRRVAKWDFTVLPEPGQEGATR